jgi:thiol-disulfide isomerase/thioredoxin
MFAPVLEAAAGKYEDVVFAKVDVDAEQGLAARAGIVSIPTLLAFPEGVLVFSPRRSPVHSAAGRTGPLPRRPQPGAHDQ